MLVIKVVPREQNVFIGGAKCKKPGTGNTLINLGVPTSEQTSYSSGLRLEERSSVVRAWPRE